MEVKINREIREYTESMFFGLSLRQFLFSLVGIAAAVAIYFGLHSLLGSEVVSWLCILGAAPFAALGFIRYHGMPAERFAVVWFKSEVLLPKKLAWHSVNLYQEAFRNRKVCLKLNEKEGECSHDN